MTLPHAASPAWIEAEYLRWRESPESVSPAWRAFFTGFELGSAPAEGTVDREYALKQSGVQSLIYRYRDLGHLLACTDPLNPCRIFHPLLDLALFDLDDNDLDTVFFTRRFFLEKATLREVLEVLRETYCRSIGVEYMHIQDPAERRWFQERMEPNRNRPSFSMDDKLRILAKIQEAALFEGFLHRKFVGQKRFSLEGGEALIPLLDGAVRKAAELGCRDVVIGMAHRGRLNVLANILGKPYGNIFDEFRDNLDGVIGDGDVKYHKGFSADVESGGRTVHVTLAPNPSHLEAVDPVAEGKARARQERYGAAGEDAVLPILIHGDAAFAGQGVVAETLNLSQLEGYRTGGTLHIVVNNQIGFTTLPADSRSSRYATDIAKFVSAPVFHVHGDEPEAALHATLLALEYRKRFRKDVVVEIICYRRYGHNEGDEPAFTQPLMYETIRNRPPLDELYGRRLVEEGVAEETVRKSADRVKKRFDAAFREGSPRTTDGFAGIWRDVERDFRPWDGETGVPAERLRELAEKLAALPEGFTPHRKIADLLAKRREAVAAGEGIDWGNAETLAYATLATEGHLVRLSGQDTRRGTFNHRHAAIFDMESGAHFVPLAALGPFSAWDSSLSENAVLGFEYGYALETPNGLVAWEAQFGDFANGAQVVIDQFIAAGETKWDRVNGLVLLLPHGYEGQGAEHSSARIERWLQLCAGNNLQVVQPTTPAQMFHLLRRQVMQPFRKPLAVFTPKSLLRHPACVSGIGELAAGRFREVLDDSVDPAGVTTLLICTGKIYYDLVQKREDERRDVAVIRIEQLYPLRDEALAEAVWRYEKAVRFRWVQEEPENMGAWNFIRKPLSGILGKEPAYVGREADSAPAVGSHGVHAEQQAELLRKAFE